MRWAGGDSHMNPISSGSQTPKWCWQEPQLPSQRWPGERRGAGAVVTRGGAFLPRSPPFGGGGAAEGVLRAGPGGARGGAGRGQREFRASGGRRPRLNPRHLPLIAADGGGAGLERTPNPWRRVCGPRTLSAGRKLQGPISPSPGGARGSRNRSSRPSPIPVTVDQRGGAQPTAPPPPPQSQPKKEKVVPGPQPHLRRPPSPVTPLNLWLSHPPPHACCPKIPRLKILGPFPR